MLTHRTSACVVAALGSTHHHRWWYTQAVRAFPVLWRLLCRRDIGRHREHRRNHDNACGIDSTGFRCDRAELACAATARFGSCSPVCRCGWPSGCR